MEGTDPGWKAPFTSPSLHARPSSVRESCRTRFTSRSSCFVTSVAAVPSRAATRRPAAKARRTRPVRTCISRGAECGSRCARRPTDREPGTLGCRGRLPAALGADEVSRTTCSPAGRSRHPCRRRCPRPGTGVRRVPRVLRRHVPRQRLAGAERVRVRLPAPWTCGRSRSSSHATFPTRRPRARQPGRSRAHGARVVVLGQRLLRAGARHASTSSGCASRCEAVPAAVRWDFGDGTPVRPGTLGGPRRPDRTSSTPTSAAVRRRR